MLWLFLWLIVWLWLTMWLWLTLWLWLTVWLWLWLFVYCVTVWLCGCVAVLALCLCVGDVGDWWCARCVMCLWLTSQRGAQARGECGRHTACGGSSWQGNCVDLSPCMGFV